MNKSLITEISRIHEMMGINPSIKHLLLENPIIKPVVREFGSELATPFMQAELKNALEDLAKTKFPKKTGGFTSMDEMTRLGTIYAREAGEEVVDDAMALTYFFNKFGKESFENYQKVLVQLRLKAAEKNLAEKAAEKAAKLKDEGLATMGTTLQLLRQNIKDGITSLDQAEALINLSLTTFRSQPKRLKENQAFIDLLEKTKKEINDKPIVAGTPISKELLDTELEKLTTTPKYKVDPQLDPTLKPIAKEVENPLQRFGIDKKEFNQRLNKKYGTSLKNKITQALQENANTRTVNVEECFEGNPSVYDPTKKGQPGWTEDGLKEEFVEFLNKEVPGFLEKLKNGEFRYVIDENGNWDQINMLNTNSGDRVLLFEDFVTNKGKVYTELTNQEVEDLMTEFLSLENSEFKKLIEKDKAKYTTNSTRNSLEGDRIEDNFDKRFGPGGDLEDLGQTVFRPKGKGNPLDFKGYDRILLNKNGDYIPIQIKKSGDIKQGKSIVFPDQDNFEFWMSSGVRLKKGYVCVEDRNGNWIVYPPQAQFNSQKITKVGKTPGTSDVINYTLKTKDGQVVKEFRRTAGKTYVDISSKPGDEFYTNIDFSRP